MKEFFPVLHMAALFSGISDEELAAMLSCLGARIGTFPKGSRLLRAGESVEEVSFDEPLNTDWDGNELLLSDILGTDGDTVLRPIEDDVDRQLLTTAVSRLSEREREIITLRFGLGGREEKTQKEVADYLGISQSYISRLEKRIIARLKREILKMS